MSAPLSVFLPLIRHCRQRTKLIVGRTFLSASWVTETGRQECPPHCDFPLFSGMLFNRPPKLQWGGHSCLPALSFRSLSATVSRNSDSRLSRDVPSRVKLPAHAFPNPLFCLPHPGPPLPARWQQVQSNGGPGCGSVNVFGRVEKSIRSVFRVGVTRRFPDVPSGLRLPAICVPEPVILFAVARACSSRAEATGSCDEHARATAR